MPLGRAYMYVRGKEITSRRLLPEGERPLPRSNSQQTDWTDMKGCYSYLCQLPIVLLHQSRINANLGRCKCRSSDKVERGIAESTVNSPHIRNIKASNRPNQFSSKPQEWLLKIVIG